ncbi:asparaginase [Mycolicibacterium nivoides]|uniref:asparaginase n=1 Tax=Mycolicibacterium nivoides TaxID=2487344 RepID=A0ABW9LM99_9MYCO
MHKPVVAVVSTGGTISCAPANGADGGLVPTSVPAESVELGDVAVRSVPWNLASSAEITFDEVVALAREIERQAGDGADAVVVTQGTDTLEEVAYALSLLRPLGQPVVLTAAMRAPTLAGSDASANLAAAIAAAIAPGLSEATCGAVVVMNDQIHSAKWVQKAHTQRLDAFASFGFGEIGVISEGRPILLGSDVPSSIPPLLPTDTGQDIKVALLTATLDQDTRLIQAIPELGYHGLVIAGVGGGHVSEAAADVLGEVAHSIPVVYASRTFGGAVLTNTYGSPGAEIDLIRRGCVPSGLLSALKTRVLLTMLLRSGYRRRQAESVLALEGSGVRAPRHL